MNMIGTTKTKVGVDIFFLFHVHEWIGLVSSTIRNIIFEEERYFLLYDVISHYLIN